MISTWNYKAFEREELVNNDFQDHNFRNFRRV